MKRTLRYALSVGALVLGLAGVANAAVTDSGMSKMHGAMQTMSGGGMMSKMMGDGRIAACFSMMKK